jgi:NADH:ubiquinone reductase (H+-translocating)
MLKSRWNGTEVLLKLPGPEDDAQGRGHRHPNKSGQCVELQVSRRLRGRAPGKVVLFAARGGGDRIVNGADLGIGPVGVGLGGAEADLMASWGRFPRWVTEQTDQESSARRRPPRNQGTDDQGRALAVDSFVNAPAAEGTGQIVVAGAGYAGLHVALRLTARQRGNPALPLTLVDRHDYHEAITELPRVAGGTRAADAVRIPLQDVLAERVRFVQAEINGVDLAGRQLLTGAGPIGWGRLVLALGSKPNDFAIPGLGQRTLSLYSASDAERVWAAVISALTATAEPERQRRLATVVIGGGGATGVELAGELAEILPEVARRHGLPPDVPAVELIEAGPTILAGSSPQLIDKAARILCDLGVRVRTNATIAVVTEEGFRLTDGQLVTGDVFVWAGGVKAPGLAAESGLPTGHNGRVKVDQYLRALDHPEIYVAGDLASVVDPRTGHALPPLAQVALEEGETVARNLDAELKNGPLEAFTFHDKGFVVSVGTRRGVADIAGITTGGRLAHVLKDAIEWEYRQSVRHLRGWDPVAH